MDNQTVGAIGLVLISACILAHRIYRGLGLGKSNHGGCGICSMGSCPTPGADENLPEVLPNLIQIGIPKSGAPQKLPESR